MTHHDATALQAALTTEFGYGRASRFDDARGRVDHNAVIETILADSLALKAELARAERASGREFGALFALLGCITLFAGGGLHLLLG